MHLLGVVIVKIGIVVDGVVLVLPKILVVAAEEKKY